MFLCMCFGVYFSWFVFFKGGGDICSVESDFETQVNAFHLTIKQILTACADTDVL